MTKQKTSERIKMLSIMAMLTALAVVADYYLRIPNIGGFLTYEPKDVIISIAAFIYNPIAGLIISLVTCLAEIPISKTGPIGLLMNFLSSATFVGVASLIYYRKKTILRAVIGLIPGSLAIVAVMLLWNYIMTPIYMGVSRELVVGMMPTLLLPFNAIKAGLNSALVLLIYKPLVTALRKSKLIPIRDSNDNENKRLNTIIVAVVSALAVATMILVLLIFAKII